MKYLIHEARLIEVCLIVEAETPEAALIRALSRIGDEDDIEEGATVTDNLIGHRVYKATDPKAPVLQTTASPMYPVNEV
jgi:citrate synthase